MMEGLRKHEMKSAQLACSTPDVCVLQLHRECRESNAQRGPCNRRGAGSNSIFRTPLFGTVCTRKCNVLRDDWSSSRVWLPQTMPQDCFHKRASHIQKGLHSKAIVSLREFPLLVQEQKCRSCDHHDAAMRLPAQSRTIRSSLARMERERPFFEVKQ